MKKQPHHDEFSLIAYRDAASALALASVLRLGRGDGDDAKRAAGAINDLERRGNDNRARCWQLVQVNQAGDAKLAIAVHGGVIWEGWGEGACLAGIRSNGFYADAKHIALFCQEG